MKRRGFILLGFGHLNYECKLRGRSGRGCACLTSASMSLIYSSPRVSTLHERRVRAVLALSTVVAMVPDFVSLTVIRIVW
jgi:hypothetical protein